DRIPTIFVRASFDKPILLQLDQEFKNNGKIFRWGFKH
ncbi:MAG: hypothetical protein ACI88H_004139, partial [Cocleimonas sp.]